MSAPDPNCSRCGREGGLCAADPCVDPASVLMEASNYMRATLLYGGSGDEFYSTIVEWWEREAGQYGRAYWGMRGEADELAVRSALAFIPGARERLKNSGEGVNAGHVGSPGGTDEVPDEAKGALTPCPLTCPRCGEGRLLAGGKFLLKKGEWVPSLALCQASPCGRWLNVERDVLPLLRPTDEIEIDSEGYLVAQGSAR